MQRMNSCLIFCIPFSAFCLLFSVFCLLFAGCWHRGELEPITFGHVAPFVGPKKYVGEHARQGILLAVEEVNKSENGINGRRLQVLHPQIPETREAILAAAERLASVNKVAGLLSGTEAIEVEGLAGIAQQYKTPLLLPSGVPGTPGSEFVFYTGMSPACQGEILARFATGAPLKALQVVVLTAAVERRGPADAAICSAVSGAFTEAFRKRGGKLVSERTYKDTGELKKIVKWLKDYKPHALVLAGSASDLAGLHEAELDEKIPVLFAGEGGSLRAVEIGQMPNMVYLATAFAIDTSVSLARQFAQEYQKRFDEAPDIHAVFAYDQARILFEAMRRAEDNDGNKVREALAGLEDFPSITGPLSFTDRRAVRAAFVVRVVNGKAETLVRYEPSGQKHGVGVLQSSLADRIAALYPVGLGRRAMPRVLQPE